MVLDLVVYPSNSDLSFNQLVSDPAAVALSGSIAVPDATGAAAVGAAAQAAMDDAATTNVVGVIADGSMLESINGSDVLSPVLFADSISSSASEPREDWLKTRANTVFTTPTNFTRNYEFKQLDLADEDDGYNVFTNSEGCYVVWVYPEGADASTDFTIVHFPGLSSVASESEVNSAAVETVVSAKTDQGLVFWVDEGNMSPFGVIRLTEWGVRPPPYPNGSGSGSSGSGSSGTAKTGDNTSGFAFALVGLVAGAIIIASIARVKSRR